MNATALRMPGPTEVDAVRAYPVARLAELWGVSRRFIYDRINDGSLRTVEFGDSKAKTRVLHTDAAAFLADRRAS